MKVILKRLLIAVMVFGIALSHTAAVNIKAADSRYRRVIRDVNEANVEDYTSSLILQERLQNIINGDIPLYKNWAHTRPVKAPLGSHVMKNPDDYGMGYYYYVGDDVNRWSGSACFIYATAVYFALFDNLITKDSENMETVNVTGARYISYANLRKWGVRDGVGSYIRVGNHSIIILGYDQERITYLDGNGNGKGTISLRTYSWNNMPSTIRKTIVEILQPTDEYYSSFFVETGDDISFCEITSKTVGFRGTLDNKSTKDIPVEMKIVSADSERVFSGTLHPGTNDLTEVLKREVSDSTLVRAMIERLGTVSDVGMKHEVDGEEYVIFTESYLSRVISGNNSSAYLLNAITPASDDSYSVEITAEIEGNLYTVYSHAYTADKTGIVIPQASPEQN